MKTASISMFAAALVCSLIATRAPLHAQPSGGGITLEGDDKPWNRGVPLETREAAKKIFQEGNRLFKVPLFAQAAEQYTAALRQWKHPAFYFNLAVAQLNLGQEVEARQNLELALKYGEEPLGADQFQEAKKQLQEVERQLGRIRITCQTRGAEVTLDGATLFTGPGNYEGWAKAQPHEITAKKPGFLDEAKRVTVSPGKLEEVDLKLVTLSEAADTGRRWAIWKPWAVVAVGAAVAATGGVLHTLSASNFSAYDKQFQQQPCATMGGCTPSEVSSDLNVKLSLATREQQIAVGGYIAGGAVIAAGVVLLYMNRPRLLEQEGTTRSAAENITVVPTFSRDAFGLLLRVSQ